MSASNEAAYMTRPMEGDAVLPEVAALAPWFHNLHLPDGSQTAPHHPLGDFPTFKWCGFADYIPADLRDWTVLDIGCNAGFYAIEMAKRGARVTAIDKDPHFLRQARWAAEVFGLEDRIEVREAQVYDLANWNQSFDLVLFLGVFYHLRYPLLGLDLVAEKVERCLVFQALMLPGQDAVQPPDDFSIDEREIMEQPAWPRMAFVEKKLAGDETNWWVPNHACVEAMLRTTGLQVKQRPAHEIYICTPNGASVAEGRTFDVEELNAAAGGRRDQRSS